MVYLKATFVLKEFEYVFPILRTARLTCRNSRNCAALYRTEGPSTGNDTRGCRNLLNPRSSGFMSSPTQR
ncbi:hypothetical protein ABZ618_00010 [Streptomyces roseolus]|uniref:hypothetical protein n=1 Tax=Streptomyces roseolus TaxID=67358 RepID=UPI0033E044CF